MAKFCFNADRKDAFEFLKTFYERVDVEFELNELNPNESCIILNDIRDRDIFMTLNERLLKIKGFSQPTYIPKWKSIRHQGPYFPEYSHFSKKADTSTLYDKNHTKQFKLLPEEEKYAFLYASIIVDQLQDPKIDDIFRNNFWLSFQKKLRPQQPFGSLDEIDWTDVIRKYREELKIGRVSDLERMQYGRVIVDGKTYAAMPFAVSEESIFYGDENRDDDRRGMIKRRITPADVTLNLSSQFIDDVPNSRDFKEIVYQPGVKWAAKWQDPITQKLKYMDIIFTKKKPDDSDDSGDEEELEPEEDDENDEVNYSDADADDDADIDIKDINDDINGDVDVDDVGINFNRQRNIDEIRIEKEWKRRAYLESVSEEDIIDFKSLDEQERNLPYSYIISEKEQWEFVYEACKSGFRIVNNLPKVSNKVLEIVADAAKIALERKGVQSPKLNYFVMDYADKREALNF